MTPPHFLLDRLVHDHVDQLRAEAELARATRGRPGRRRFTLRNLSRPRTRHSVLSISCSSGDAV